MPSNDNIAWNIRENGLILQVPYFNAPIYLDNKSSVGKVDEIFGKVKDAVSLSDRPLGFLQLCTTEVINRVLKPLPALGQAFLQIFALSNIKYVFSNFLLELSLHRETYQGKKSL